MNSKILMSGLMVFLFAGLVNAGTSESKIKAEQEHTARGTGSEKFIAQISKDARLIAIEQKLKDALPLLAEEGIVLDPRLISEDLSSKSLYFGIGLCTTKEMSVGLPFDFLGLVATAEAIRRTLGFGKIIQLIADSHAKTNHFVSDAEVDKKAHALKELSLKIVKNLGLEGKYEVILASEIDSTPEYKKIEKDMPDDGSHNYAKKEWTDMEYLARHYNTLLKVSWMMPLKKGQKHTADEVYFDNGFNERFKATPYSFIYNRAALTFDPAKLNVSPYSSASGEKRVYLAFDQVVAGEKRVYGASAQDVNVQLTEFMAVKHKAKDKAFAQLETIVNFVHHMFGVGSTTGSLGDKVNSIMKAVLR